MYNGMGLQTPKGSGTNGYVQTNKFFVRKAKTKMETDRITLTDNTKGFEGGVIRRTAPYYNKDKDMVEHERKREIEVKLVMLEDKLVDQECYTEAEIAEKLQQARKTLTLEAAAAAASASASEQSCRSRDI